MLSPTTGTYPTSSYSPTHTIPNPITSTKLDYLSIELIPPSYIDPIPAI